MTLPEWGRKALLLAIIPVPREHRQVMAQVLAPYSQFRVILSKKLQKNPYYFHVRC